jgi:hypothetical protein
MVYAFCMCIYMPVLLLEKLFDTYLLIGLLINILQFYLTLKLSFSFTYFSYE